MRNFEDLTVSDYLRIIRRRIWYLIIPTILVSAGTVLYVWRMPSVYKSETTILVADRILPEDYIGSIIRQSIADRIEFARQQLRSRVFVERIAQEFQLVGSGSNADGILNAVLDSTEITVVPPNVFKVGFYATDPSIAQAVTKRLAERVMQTNDTLRQERVSVADQMLDDQARQASDDLGQAEQKLREFYQRQFPGVPQEGINADTLGALQTQLAIADTDLQNVNDQRKAYERSLTEHRDLKMASELPRPAEAPVVPAAPPTAPARSPVELQLIQKNAELSALLARYTPQHPDVGRVKREIRDLEAQLAKSNAAPAPAPSIQAVADSTPVAPAKANTSPTMPEIDYSVDFYEAEVRRELDQLNREIAKRETLRKELASRVAVYARRMNMPPEVMQELATLTQEREAARQRYTYVSTKKLTSDLAGKVDTNANNKTFTTIDPPNLPQTPIRPNRTMLTTAGCLASLLLGIALAAAREFLDPTVRDQESAAAELQLPVFTSIPTVDGISRKEKKLEKKRKKLSILNRKNQSPTALKTVTAGPRSFQFSDRAIREVVFGGYTIAREQYQMMRAELMTQKQRGIKSIIVTSAVPNEGKTFIACCLAGILGKEQGKKVLLIDADVRTANAGQALGLDDRNAHPGLTDVLNGSADIENCLILSDELNLSFLPAGTAIENPVEMLSSPRLQQVMRELTMLFDWIILDSAPVLPIADTTLLVPVCDIALVVVRADRTPISMAKDLVNKIGRDRVAGIIVNCVRGIKSTYYYGNYYHRLVKSKK